MSESAEDKQLAYEIDDLLSGFLQTLVDNIGDDILDHCLTVVREADINKLTEDYLESDDLNLVEKMLVTHCRAIITFERSKMQ